MRDEEIDALFERANAFADARQQQLIDRFGLGSLDQWSADLTVPAITFSVQGRRVFGARLLVVGTTVAGAWRWAWANASLPPVVREASKTMQQFGAQTGLAVFIRDAWPCSEEQAWSMTSLACMHVDGAGVYRIPSRDASVYVVLRDIDPAA